jgi:hypothetical protein
MSQIYVMLKVNVPLDDGVDDNNQKSAPKYIYYVNI